MGKELRLGFAMGGGVSLGTFSGAVLSEAIKLLILHNQQYEKITIDVFSGASAGALTLVLMLRNLSHRTASQERRAERDLQREYGARFDNLAAARKQDMIAAQVVQNAMEDAWVKDISLDRFLQPRPDQGRGLRYQASLLDTRAIEEIARDHVGFRGELPLDQRRLLGDRVLFCCTLSNVSPILVDARKELPTFGQAGIIGLADGMTSYVHRELRVFDLYFERITTNTLAEKADVHPSRWCRYRNGGEASGKIGDLRLPKTWAKITATAIASGSFPVAFEPVVLKRDFYEMPAHLRKRLASAGFEKEYPFTYVDGGTFNNEPIREAFRLASFIDSYNPGDFDRRIIFVDPNIPDSVEPPLRVAVHQKYAFQTSDAPGAADWISLLRRTTLDRLIPHSEALLKALFDEARIVEADKIFQTRENFQLRDNARRQFARVLTRQPSDEMFRGLIDYCQGILNEDRQELMMPGGALSIDRELARVIAEQSQPRNPNPDPDLSPLQGQVDAFLQAAQPSQVDHANLWLLALSLVTMDLVMNLEGKSEHSQLIAIAPIFDPKGKDWRPALLPGGALGGFAGFMSIQAGKYEVKVARYVTRQFLEAAHMIPAEDEEDPPEFKGRIKTQFEAEVEAGLVKVSERLAEALEEAHVLNLWLGLDKVLLGFLANVVKKKVRTLGKPKPHTITYEFRIQVPDKHFEWDGQGPIDRDIPATQLAEGGPWTLITFVDYILPEEGTKEAGRWDGPHMITAGPDTHLKIDRDGLFDRLFCRMRLPDEALRKRAEMYPYPIFTATVRDADKDQLLEADRWQIENGATPLEETLFG